MTFLARIRNSLAALRDDQSGSIAIEFAVVVPILLLALIPGSFEVTNAVMAKRKTNQAATILADLATQASTIDDTAWTSMSTAVDKVLYPYDTLASKTRVIGVKIDKNKKVTTAWSYGSAPLDVSSLPASLIVKNSFYVMSATEVTYTPILTGDFVGTMTFRDTAIMAPRLSSEVTKK